MPIDRIAILALFAAVGVVHAEAREPVRYLDIVNRAPDSVMSLEAAPAGGDAFLAIPLAAPLQGGEATTVSLAERGCRYDVRVAFRTGRTVVYRGVDACRRGGIYIDRPPG